MVCQNKIFSFKIKRQAKKVFHRDVERTVSIRTTKTRLFKYIENFTTKEGKFSDKKF